MTEQLTVFLENRAGRVDEVLRILKDNQVNIFSASLADASDFGLLRMIVEEPEKAKDVLGQNGIFAKVSPIVLVAVSHEIGGLYDAINLLTEAGISVEYMYGLSTYEKGAAIAIKTSNLEKTEQIFDTAEVPGVKLYTIEGLKALVK